MKTYCVHYQNLTLYVVADSARHAVQVAERSSINYAGGLGRFLGIRPLGHPDMHLVADESYTEWE